MIYKAIVDIKKGDDIHICDKCDQHTNDPQAIKDDEWVYCPKCYSYTLDMGDMAAEAAMERELERKHEADEKA